ncbi:MAG: flagellar biosynthesis protein FlgA, partial [Alphaproteobacteria bacterium]|nr:flagellar biosynthesis protein FlgA [Alphaproteobacteria bacterium]
MNISFPRLMGLYFRIVILLLCLSVGVMFLVAGARVALAASLKTVSIINGDSMTVGDIFDGLPPEKASYILGPSPAAGKDMVLDARDLMRIAIALDLPWRPDSSADKITVRRNATIIDKTVIDDGLRSALLSKGLDGAFDIAYSTGTPTIALNPGLPATFDVTALELDRTQDTFRATLSAPSADDAQSVTTLSGTIRHKVAVPVLKSTLKNGDIISARDLDLIEIFARDLQPDMVLDMESAVGLTPRRVIA